MQGITPEAMAAFNALDEMTGGIIKDRVTSGYRSPEHNAKVGGAKHSQHTHGNAFDINVADMPKEQRLALIEKAKKAGFRGIGVYDNALHFDVGPERAWGPSYSRDSLPQWAAGAVGGGTTQGGGYSMGTPVAQTQEPPMNRLMQFQLAANALPKWQSVQLDPRDFMNG